MDKPEDQGQQKSTEAHSTEEKVAGDKSAEPKKSESKVSDITGKIPDISTLTSKFDLDKILGGIKSMINPEQEAAITADPNDALAMKIEQLNSLFKELSQTHAKLAKDFANASDTLVSLFKDLEAVRQKNSS